jgi:hypothetical protein
VKIVDKIKFIPLDELEVGKAYELQARNIRYGIWDGEMFHGIRVKFGQKFMDCKIHWDLCDRHGTANAIRELK